VKEHAKEIIVLAVLVIILGVAAFFLLQDNKPIMAEATTPSSQPEATQTPQPTATATPEPTATPTPTPIPTPEPPQVVTLLFAGDVMGHEKQLEYHKFGSNYDFTMDYKYIKDIISKADIALCNVEAPLKGEPPYTGFPYFNMPDSIADALWYAGFDVIANANNHTHDQLGEAIGRTAKVFNDKGFTVVGTATGEADDKKYDIVEKNGIKVGFVNFTNSMQRGIGYDNKNIGEETNKYVNLLRRNQKYDVGYAMMKEQIDALRAEGADFIVVYMHWGNEGQIKGNATQKEMGRKIADLGADLIVGNHPHVPQDVTEYTSTVTGKTVLIYYSLGNLVSNQSYGYGLGHGYNETHIMALIKLKRGEDGKVAVEEAGYMTTYVHKPNIEVKYTDNGEERTKKTKAYFIVPAQLAAADPSAYEGLKGSLLSHVKTGIQNGQKLTGKSAEKLTFYSFFKEYTDWPW
jgi:poly-gamma-glutamate capsule biosynthesis protein CapA/YwtB (metallophosphatase superfamily)